MTPVSQLAPALAALAFALPLAAQQAPDTAYVPPVVVTATHAPLTADRVPASVTVVTGAELRAQGVAHLTDALRSVPGVTIAQSGSYGAPATLFVRGGQGSYTKVLIDGVPANEPGAAFDFGTLTVDDVERIEVVRGPSSVVWGSDAISAVVHIITRRGAVDRGSVSARGGTYGTADINGALERGTGAWRGALTGAHHRSSGSYDLNSAYRSGLLSGSATWSATPATQLRATARHADLTAHFPTDYTGAPVDPNAFRTEGRTTASAELTQAAGPVTASVTVGHSLVIASSVDPANADGMASTRFDTRTRRQQLELRADAPLAPFLTLTAGGVLERQYRSGAFTTVTPGDGGAPGVDRQVTTADRANRGGYLELLGTSGPTTATVGGRVDDSEQYGTFATYRIGISHALRAGSRLRASVGTAFREPTFDEVLPSAFSSGNPSLEPERTASWEVGAEQRLAAGRVVFGATYFSQRFARMIDYFSESFPGRYENVAAARARGTELEVRVRPTAAWVLDGSLTLLRTRVETAGFGGALAAGRALLRRPERSATAGITRTGVRGTVAARMAYVGRRTDVRYLYDAPYSAEETLPAYTRVDVSGELPVAVRGGQSLALTVRVENAAGARYETVAGYTAPGRTLLGGVRAAF